MSRDAFGKGEVTGAQSQAVVGNQGASLAMDGGGWKMSFPPGFLINVGRHMVPSPCSPCAQAGGWRAISRKSWMSTDSQ